MHHQRNVRVRTQVDNTFRNRYLAWPNYSKRKKVRKLRKIYKLTLTAHYLLLYRLPNALNYTSLLEVLVAILEVLEIYVYCPLYMYILDMTANYVYVCKAHAILILN